MFIQVIGTIAGLLIVFLIVVVIVLSFSIKDEPKMRRGR
jgi:hypothetical protein